MVIQNRSWLGRLDADALITTGVAIHPYLAECPIGLLVLVKELARSLETIHERALASRAFGVGKEMQGLQSGRLGKIGVVVVGLEAFARVCRVLARQIGREVVESACVVSAKCWAFVTLAFDHRNGYS